MSANSPQHLDKSPDVDHLWPTAFNIILTARQLHAALAMPIDGDRRTRLCTGWARRPNGQPGRQAVPAAGTSPDGATYPAEPGELPRPRAQRHPRVRRARQPVSVERQVMIRAEEAVEPQWPSALTAIDIRVRAGGERVSRPGTPRGRSPPAVRKLGEARGGPCQARDEQADTHDGK